MELKYIPKGSEKNLINYRYRGTDTSITYNYFLSPLAEFLVRFFPKWISPNVITLMGCICSLSIYMVTVLICGLSTGCKIPNEWIIISSALYFGWLILDNIDGKQARRIQLSSPLGLIFDHQVDALHATITTAFLASAFLYGGTKMYMLVWFIGGIPFFYATWEELYVGSMNFGMLNGPSDGAVLMGLMTTALGVIGPEFFTGKLAGDWEIREVLYTVIVVFSIAISVLNVLNVWKMNKTSEPYLKTVAIYYFSIAIFMVVFLSPADLGVVAGREVGLCIGFVFAKEIAFIQIAHVTNTKYTPLLSANFLIISAMIFNTLTHAYGISVADEYNFQVCLTIASFLSYAHLAYYLSLEISTILGIPIFRVPRKNNIGEKQK